MYLNEVGLFGSTHDDHTVDFRLKFNLFGFLIVHKPLRDPSFAMPVLKQDESDLH